MKKILFFFCISLSLCAQTPAVKKPKALPALDSGKPRLVVGIVVDQMSYDFLMRYDSKYSQGGFKRLVREGFLCKNAHYNYIPTTTGAGHTCTYTGSIPAVHGIAGNEWIDKRTGKTIYCVDDTTVQTVGSESQAGRMSPRNLLTTTITDQLRLSNNHRSRVVGVALKDRGAILPAGHLGNAAYWFDSFSGNWITSTYYRKDLPDWVQQFNNQKLPAKYLSQPWTPLLHVSEYSESTPDDQPFEGRFKGETTSAFPHDLPKLKTADFDLIRSTPFGNSLTKDFAMAVLTGEKLGKGITTDFLTISFSSTDYIGHQFGPHAIETEDVYLRLDRDLAELLAFLDTWVGKSNLLVFLTADHGVAPVADYMQKLNIPAGVFDSRKVFGDLKKSLSASLGEGEWIQGYENQQLYLNHVLLAQKGKSVEDVYEKIQTFLMAQEGVAYVVNLHEPSESSVPDYFMGYIKNGTHLKRSGDILVAFEPFWMEGRKQGTTHSTFYPYDTHVPVLFYGGLIQPGSTTERVHVADIAPTVAMLLNILEPNGCVGEPIDLHGSK